jgi:hypothetical protein
MEPWDSAVDPPKDNPRIDTSRVIARMTEVQQARVTSQTGNLPCGDGDWMERWYFGYGSGPFDAEVIAHTQGWRRDAAPTPAGGYGTTPTPTPNFTPPPGAWPTSPWSWNGYYVAEEQFTTTPTRTVTTTPASTRTPTAAMAGCFRITVTPAADLGINAQGPAVDGWPPSGAAVADASDATTAHLVRSYDGATYYMSNYVVRYDTGTALPDSVTVIGATLYQWIAAPSRDDCFALRFRYFDAGAALDVSDYDPNGSHGVTAHAAACADVMLWDGTLHGFTLSSPTNISTTAPTDLRVLWGGAAAPGGVNSLFTATNDITLPWQKPYLEIDYCLPTPTPTTTRTSTGTATVTPTFTPVGGNQYLQSTPTPLATYTATPPSTATRTATATATFTPTFTPVGVEQYLRSTPTPLATYTGTATQTATATHTGTATLTSTPTITPTFTPVGVEQYLRSTPTPLATDTPTTTPTTTPTVTATPTITPTFTPVGVEQYLHSTPTVTPSPVATNTPTDTPSQTPTSTPTDTPTDTPTVTPSMTPTVTPTSTPTLAGSPHVALVPTNAIAQVAGVGLIDVCVTPPPGTPAAPYVCVGAAVSTPSPRVAPAPLDVAIVLPGQASGPLGRCAQGVASKSFFCVITPTPGQTRVAVGRIGSATRFDATGDWAMCSDQSLAYICADP